MLAFDDWIGELHFHFTGLGRDDWIDWPLDRVLAYWNAKLERTADRYEALDRHISSCNATKVRPNVVFAFAVE